MTPTADTLQRSLGLPRPTALAVRRLLRRAVSSTQVWHVLASVDLLVHGFGVEVLPGADRHAVYYVNRGDTYTPTVLYDTRTGRFIVAAWGDLVERQPRRFAA